MEDRKNKMRNFDLFFIFDFLSSVFIIDYKLSTIDWIYYG